MSTILLLLSLPALLLASLNSELGKTLSDLTRFQVLVNCGDNMLKRQEYINSTAPPPSLVSNLARTLIPSMVALQLLQ